MGATGQFFKVGKSSQGSVFTGEEFGWGLNDPWELNFCHEENVPSRAVLMVAIELHHNIPGMLNS